MPTHVRSSTQIKASGNKPKVIDEFFGKVNTGTDAVSIAHMQSPPGWVEPGQTPEFDEYTVVLRGVLQINFHGGRFDVHAGQAVLAHRGEWVQYSSPYEEGADYIAVCLPAFGTESVHRDVSP